MTSKPAMWIHATASKATFITHGKVILARMESGGAFLPVMASSPLARRPMHSSWSNASTTRTSAHTKNGSAQQPASYMCPPRVGPSAHAWESKREGRRGRQHGKWDSTREGVPPGRCAAERVSCELGGEGGARGGEAARTSSRTAIMAETTKAAVLGPKSV